MNSIYQEAYICKAITPIGLLGYNDVVLGLAVGSGNSDIYIKGTVSRFIVGKAYLISIMEGA